MNALLNSPSEGLLRRKYCRVACRMRVGGPIAMDNSWSKPQETMKKFKMRKRKRPAKEGDYANRTHRVSRSVIRYFTESAWTTKSMHSTTLLRTLRHSLYTIHCRLQHIYAVISWRSKEQRHQLRRMVSKPAKEVATLATLKDIQMTLHCSSSANAILQRIQGVQRIFGTELEQYYYVK